MAETMLREVLTLGMLFEKNSHIKKKMTIFK